MSSSSFYERFRAEIARYAEGVHRLGAPAPAAVAARAGDAELASFLQSWNGAELFVDAYTIRAADAIERDGESIWFGETAVGDRLAIEGGRVLRYEEDTGEIVVEGTSFAKWLEGTVVAEGVLYDREGEFAEDAYEGEELAPAAQLKREKKYLKIDAGAPGPMLRLARALERTGDARGARKRLEELVGAWPDMAWAWFDLGRLRRDAGDAEDAQQAFTRATERAAEQGVEHAGFFAAQAARVAAERGDETARAQLAARALEIDADAARGLRKAAQARAEDEQLDEALELAELAAALAPRDLEIAELRRRLKKK